MAALSLAGTACGGTGGECSSNSDCSDPTPICDTANDICVGCLASSDCAGPTPVCDTNTSTCVECGDSTDCGPAEVCDPVGHICVLTPDPASSTDIADIYLDPASASGIEIEEVAVTYIKPALGDENAGFFVQAEQYGPAIFVASDPNGTVAVGDIVTFTVESALVNQGRTEVTSISALFVVASGYDVTQLTQEVSNEPDLVTAIDDFEAELITATFNVQTDFGGAGTAHSSAQIDTTAIPGSADLEFRLADTLLADLGIFAGCELTVSDTSLS